MKHPSIFFFISILYPVFSFATTPVSGIVQDQNTNEPLPFTTIVILGQSRGTVSNVEGRFILDLQGVADEDTVAFSYVGYETRKLLARELQVLTTVDLQPATVNLGAVAVLSSTLSVEEILERVVLNYERNHSMHDEKQRMFYHKYEQTSFPKENKVHLKESDFAGLGKESFYELFNKLPDKFIEYQDAIVELYQFEEGTKMVPIEAISLEEGSQQELFKEMENRLSSFFEDIEQAKQDEEVYFKFRSGIFAMDVDEGDLQDSLIQEAKQDALHYSYNAESVKSELVYLNKEYASLNSKNWEFITKTKKYNYALNQVTVFDDELVYQIDFSPKKGGLFEGSMFISTETYGLLQLDFAFAEGKSNENIQLLGIGHSMVFKRARVIFEKGVNGYYIKYINAQQHEKASIERNFSFMKKERRFLFDKTLNEMKVTVDVFFDIQSFWELLVIDHSPVDSQQFKAVNQPNIMKFKKEYAYSPDAWKNRTVIAPSDALKTYKRQE